MKIKNQDLNFTSQILSTLTIPQSLGVKSIVDVLDLTENVQSLEKKFADASSALFKSFEVKTNDKGHFDWTDHENAQEITEKFKELSALENEVKTSFEKDFHLNFIKDKTIAELLVLKAIFSE